MKSNEDPRTDGRIGQLVGPARALAEALGYDMGLRLMTEFGGMRIDIPKRPLPKWVVWRALGEKAAKALCHHFGTRRIEIPVASRIARLARNHAIATHEGSHNEAARQFGVSRRWVKMVRRGAREQGELFGAASKRG
jgi:hypothetical protein